jgi:hypothetical protein
VTYAGWAARLCPCCAKAIASLIAPEKLATLKERGANPRVQKYVAQLAWAKREGKDEGQGANRGDRQRSLANRLAS